VLAALQAAQTLPPCLPDLLDELAASLDATLTGEQACARLLDIAAKLDPVALGATSLAGQIAVGQLRVAVVDLLEGLGLEHDRARNTLPRLA
jgi:hypothetical protein